MGGYDVSISNHCDCLWDLERVEVLSLLILLIILAVIILIILLRATLNIPVDANKANVLTYVAKQTYDNKQDEEMSIPKNGPRNLFPHFTLRQLSVGCLCRLFPFPRGSSLCVGRLSMPPIRLCMQLTNSQVKVIVSSVIAAASQSPAGVRAPYHGPPEPDYTTSSPARRASRPTVQPSPIK